MKYLYYPGCSLEGTAGEYDASTRAFLSAMGMELTTLEDWTCCGASAAQAVSQLLTLALAARNLALAERNRPGLDLLVPCSACYLNLKKAGEAIRSSNRTRQLVNAVLAEEGLAVQGAVRVRHLLDVLARDLDMAQVAAKIQRPLTGLVVAPYYGCQCLRPYPLFDDGEAPVSMQALIRATGARVHPWAMGPKCCGASHMQTKMAVGLELSGAILSAARGADAIVTVCPMCQMNLEAHQKKISRQRTEDLTITIVYLPQLLGLALRMDQASVELGRNLAVSNGFKEKIKAMELGKTAENPDRSAFHETCG
jgi:heterodisulfide reductase subunit B